MPSTWLATVNVDFDHLAEVVLSGFPTLKLLKTSFFVVVEKIQRNFTKMNSSWFLRNWKLSGSYWCSLFGTIGSLISFTLGVFFIISLFSDFTILLSLCFLTWLPATCPTSLSPLPGHEPAQLVSHFLLASFPITGAPWSHLGPITVTSTCPWTNLIAKTTLWGGTSLVVVQWLGLGAFIAKVLGSIPGRGTKILQAVRRGRKKKNTVR